MFFMANPEDWEGKKVLEPRKRTRGITHAFLSGAVFFGSLLLSQSDNRYTSSMTSPFSSAEQSTGQKKKSRWEVMPNNIPLLPGEPGNIIFFATSN